MDTINITNPSKRFLKISRFNNYVDLSDSFNIHNNKLSKLLFESEIYKITFKTLKKSYNLFLTANELICNDCIKYLKKELGIEVSGDGLFFEIINYTQNFEIIFDIENTTFINTNSVQNGVICFCKESH